MADFVHYKGSDRNFYVDWTLSGSPLNITAATTITVNFKKQATDTDTILQKTLAGGGVTVTTPTNRMTIVMDETDFANLAAAETELQVGVTMVLAGRTYKKAFTISVVVVP